MRLLSLKLLLLACWWVLSLGLTSHVSADDLEALVGTYQRLPVENDWHVGKIEINNRAGAAQLKWTNKAGRSWNLIPDLKQEILRTDRTNPYFDTGQREFRIKKRDGKIVGFEFQNTLYVRDGAKILPQMSGGFHGYISMSAESPPKGFGYGASFYVSVWPLMEAPLSGFQIGLPSTWIIPDNRDFKQALCPPGTVARDNWPERGPYYRSVFQTIEGGLGYWVSTRFRSATPKYRINGTPNGYNHEISSPGWGFGKTKPLTAEQMGIAQLSNRLLIPPDGLTLESGANEKIIGNAWMAMDWTSPDNKEIRTGDQSWTLFLNTANFKGPVAFFLPETWSQLSRGYKTIEGRGLDARPGLMGSGAMEVNTVPYFEATDSAGVTYSKIPKLQFPVGQQGQTILMQDINFYSKNAVRSSGAFSLKKSWKPKLTASPISFDQGPKRDKLKQIDKTVQTAIFGDANAQAFGLKWSKARGIGKLPQYFRQTKKGRVAIDEDEVPKDLGLIEQEFSQTANSQEYQSPESRIWTQPGPQSPIFTASLNDGSVVSYAWYRFVDQPSIRALNWNATEKARVQKAVERIHRQWTSKREYMPRPTTGELVGLDDAIIVSPPSGLEIGYVPIVVNQRLSSGNGNK